MSKRSFGICTHNVLASKWLQWQRSGDHGYTNIPVDSPFITDFDYRFERESAYLQAQNCDIYCLQEMEQGVFESHYTPFFETLGFEGVFQKTKNKYPIATATFWRKSLFALDWSEFRSRTMLLRLTDSSCSKPLYIVNCHLEGNKVGVYKCEQRVNQLVSSLAKLQSQIESRKETVSTAAVVLVGDLNALPNEEIHELLTDGVLKAGRVQATTANTYVGDGEFALSKDAEQPFRMRSALLTKLGREPKFTFVGKDHTFCLDYVYVQNLSVEAAVDPSREIDETTRVALLGAIPNEKIPSDHLALTAQLTREDENEES